MDWTVGREMRRWKSGGIQWRSTTVVRSKQPNTSIAWWLVPINITEIIVCSTQRWVACLLRSGCILTFLFSLLKDVSRDLFSDIEKEPEIEELKPKSFWWRRASKRLYQYMINKRFEESVVHFQCYESTKAVVHRLKPKAIYYADVFVRNKWNNLTSAYWTSNFTLTEPESDSAFMAAFSSRQLLHDSLYTGVFLDTKNKFKKRFYFKATPILSNKIYIYVQPCSGLGPVQFLIRQAFTVSDYRRKRHEDNGIDSETIITSTKAEESDESVLYFEEITETKTIELSLPVIETNDTVLLEFELNTVAHRQSRSLILLASSGLNRFPFPRLPVERTVRVRETIFDCLNLTYCKSSLWKRFENVTQSRWCGMLHQTSVSSTVFFSGMPIFETRPSRSRKICAPNWLRSIQTNGPWKINISTMNVIVFLREK